MGIIEKIVSAQPVLKSKRIEKKQFNKPLTQAQEDIIRCHLSLKRLAHREFIRLPQDIKDTLNIQFSRRKTLVDYVVAGIRASSITAQRPKERHGIRSSLQRRKIPTYIDPKDNDGNSLGKYIRYVDTKLALEYGSVDDPIRVHADTLLFHKGQKYFGLYWRDLRRNDRVTYLTVLEKVGNDIFGKSYGGFVIFFPSDDETISLQKSKNISPSRLENIAQEVNSERELQHNVKAVQKKQRVCYKNNAQTKIAQKLYDSFGTHTHLIGLPFDISRKDDYFFNMTPKNQTSRKAKQRDKRLSQIGYEGIDKSSIRY